MNFNISENILNWYPFKKNMSVLEICSNLEGVTETLCENCQEVVTLEIDKEKAQLLKEKYREKENLEIITGKIQDISNIGKKFDIITLIGIIPKINQLKGEQISLVQLMKDLEQFLKDDGKFLIAVDNKFGLRYFAGNPENILNRKFESLIGYSNEPQKIETFTKKSLEQAIKSIGYDTNFYYPLPDYKLPNVIFTDEDLPEYNSIDKYIPYPEENSDTIINEIDVFREILKTDPKMFSFFANSFLIEASHKKTEVLYKYVSFNNIRKKEYRLITKISNTYVEKQVVNKYAQEHYNNIKKNIDILKQNGINTVDYIENGIIKSKYIDQKYLLNTVLTKCLEEKRIDEFDSIIQRYIEILKINSKTVETIEGTVFEKYQIQLENMQELKGLHFVKNGLWDMTFTNCFYMDKTFHFFDQEWNEENLPIEFILYRSILYTISLRRYVNIDILFDKYNLTKYRKIFEQLDNVLQEKIRDNEIWQYYNRNTHFDIDSTKQELINIGIRDNAKQLAIENLETEKQQLINNNEQIELQKQQLQQQIQQLQDEVQKTNDEKNKIQEEKASVEQRCQYLQSELDKTLYEKIKRTLKNRIGNKMKGKRNENE